MSGETAKPHDGRAIPVEADLLILSFLGHFAWELLQAPLFSSLDEASHFDGIAICLRATIGDLGIALAAFWAAAVVGGGRGWIGAFRPRPVATFFAVGLILTVGIEAASAQILNRWTYAPEMPRLPILGTGLAPIAQWLVVPSLALWYLKRLSPRSESA